MEQNSDELSEIEILKNISDAFSRFRADSSGHVPKDLKKLASQALVCGIKRNQIAAAAGVAPKTISNWSLSFKPQAKQLCIISEPITRVERAPEPTPVLIRLRSGVEIEFTKLELNNELLTLLNNLGGER
jgi:hypothetical protein